MKNEAVFKKSFNALLDHVGGLNRGCALESESQLADILKVSRTTVRKALSELELRGLTRRDGNPLQARKRPTRSDYFPIEDTVATSDQVEQKFLEWILRSDRRPGQQINGLELARQFDVST